MCGKSVKLAILMLSLLLWAVASAGATIIVAVSSNWGNGCTAPVTSFMLVVVTIALTVVVCLSKYSRMKLENADKAYSVLVLGVCRRTSCLRS